MLKIKPRKRLTSGMYNDMLKKLVKVYPLEFLTLKGTPGVSYTEIILMNNALTTNCIYTSFCIPSKQPRTQRTYSKSLLHFIIIYSLQY